MKLLRYIGVSAIAFLGVFVIWVMNTKSEAPSPPTPVQNTPSISQGVYGQVERVSGNCMPGIAGEDVRDNPCENGFIATSIFVREPLAMTYYWENTSPLVAQGASNENGFYEVELPPGDYSIFVDDNGAEYCNGSSDGIACPITIREGELLEMNLTIDHAAW